MATDRSERAEKPQTSGGSLSRGLAESRSSLFLRRANPNPNVFLPFIITATNRPLTVSIHPGGPIRMSPPSKPSQAHRSQSPLHLHPSKTRFRVEGRSMHPGVLGTSVEPKNRLMLTSASAEMVTSALASHKSALQKPIRVKVARTKRNEPEADTERMESIAQREGLFYKDVGEISERAGGETKTVLLAPIFRGRPHTVLFMYPPQCGKPVRSSIRFVATHPEDLRRKPLTYTFPETAHVYSCIRHVLEYNGFAETDGSDFSLFLSGDITPKLLQDFDPFQKYNHFPGSWQLGRKDNLWRNVTRMRRLRGEEFDFCPATFVFPEDFARFQREREAHPSDLWILKPVASSCGRGIRILSSKSRVKSRSGYLASAYISNPHLLNGLKYDLRLYVCVTSYDPLRIYLYREGLVRFAAEEYTTEKSRMSQRFVHLTNYSVNKHAAEYKPNRETKGDYEGHKWSHTAYRRRLTEMGIDAEALFARIKDLIVKTVISAEPAIVNSTLQYTHNRGNCFETYGFDVLLDETLRPWLMEVNVSPSLNSESPLDRRIKTSLIADVYTLVGFVPCDREVLWQDSETQRQNRILGLSKSKQKRPSLQSVASCRSLDELDLPEAEITMMMERDEEVSRCGDFECLFPVKDTVEKYAALMEVERVNNRLLWKLIREDAAFLAKYSLGPTARV